MTYINKRKDTRALNIRFYEEDFAKLEKVSELKYANISTWSRQVLMEYANSVLKEQI